MTTGKKSGISAWPEDERPRERLLSRGADALTDAELVAVVLRTGVAGKTAIDMARDLLSRFGSLREMTEAPISRLMEVKGLKKAKAAQLAAAMEISRRAGEGRRGERTRFTSTEAARRYCHQTMQGLQEEHFYVLFLNRQNVLLERFLVAKGDTAEVPVSLRKIVARALTVKASGVIASHNHPSGVTTPSNADRRLTHDLVEATRLLGIRVLDHIIVGDDTYSFADNGEMDALESSLEKTRNKRLRKAAS